MSRAGSAPHRRSRTLLTVATSLALLGTIALVDRPVAGQPPGLPTTLAASHAQDRVIVGFEPGLNRVQRQRALGEGPASAAASLSPLARDALVVTLGPDVSVEQAIEQLRARPGVAYVEPDYRVHVALSADDPWYADGSLWGMHGDDTGRYANAFGTGAGEAWRAGHVGDRRVHVGVVDEGVSVGHPDLAANIWTNPGEVINGLDDDGNGYVDDIHGWDFFNDDASVYDGVADDHGTHVAGTIGARGGNGIGVAGVNWRVSIVPVKFLGAAGGYVSGAVRALDYLTDLKSRHGLHLVATNNSWTGGGYSQALADAIDRGGDAGILFVAAAGNEGVDIDDSPVYPGAYTCQTEADGDPRGWDCVISVANLEPDGDRNPESNWGKVGVDLVAPGTGIVSTHPQDDGYASYSGTSMAAPHVAGAAALCASVGPARSASWIREAILDVGAPTGSALGRTATGDRLDIGALMERCAPESPATPPPTMAPTPTPDQPLHVTFVDDLDPTFKRWGPGWAAEQSGHAGHHYRLPARDDERVGYGAWRPTLPVAGSYRIMAYIPSGATSRAATYKVRTADGWVTRVRNQHARQGSWVGLGIHELTTTPSIRLADVTGEPIAWGRRLAFDAIKFVLLDTGEARTEHALVAHQRPRSYQRR